MKTTESTLGMAVVLVTDSWATIRPVVESLKRTQPIGRVELVLVSPNTDDLTQDSSGLDDFGKVTFVQHPVPPLHEARACGVRKVTAPWVFIGETHSFPREGMIENLIAAHEEGWEIVVPQLENANPIDAVSWGNFVTDYGAWGEGQERSPSTSVPVYNASFASQMLQALGPDLDLTLGQGDKVYETLAHRRILHEPASRIGHVNLCTLRPGFTERLLVGIMIGSRRLSRWSRLRGLAYAAASPLIALTLMSRVWPNYRRIGRLRNFPFGTFLIIVANCIIRALGEMWGYLGWPAEAAAARQDGIEIHKLKLTRLTR